MRVWMVLVFAVLGACATQQAGQSGNTVANSARFPEFPTRLYGALEASCTEPAQQYIRLSRNVAECREFLEPRATAAIILSYDGTADDLPQLVIRLSARPDGGEYLLTTDAYLNVPRKDKQAIRVVYSSPRFERSLQKLYRVTGGVPE